MKDFLLKHINQFVFGTLKLKKWNKERFKKELVFSIYLFYKKKKRKMTERWIFFK